MKILLLNVIIFSSYLFAQLPVINGWTQFSPSSDSRIIYVSATGNDATAQSYAPTDPEVGSNPFLPTGSILPYQTIAAAVTQLRDGYPDWILFKKGDSFVNQNLGSTDYYGKNRTEPMLFASYGTSNDRPKIMTGNQQFWNATGSSANYLAFVGLEIFPHTRTTSDDPVGFRIIDAPFTSILIEDCHIHHYFQLLAFHDPVITSTPTRSNFKLRRSILERAYTLTSAHANAMFLNNIDSILFEENLLDHNGWDTIAGANPTSFRHNSYFQVGCRNLLFRENIVSRAGATGGGFRCGGNIFNNTFLSNPKNIQFGTFETTIDWPTEYVTGLVNYNVVLDSRVEPMQPGIGLTSERTKNSIIRDNIIAHFTPVSDYNYAVYLNETENVHFDHNIIYNWGNNSSGIEYSSGIIVGNSLIGTTYIDSNHVQMKNSQGYCQNKYTSFSNVSYSFNSYYNINSASNWFAPSGTYASWVTASGETGSEEYEIPYLDPNRNVSTYMASIGMSGDLSNFIEQRKLMSKHNWNSDFTANTFNNYIRYGFGRETLNQEMNNNKSLKIYPNPSSDGIFYMNINDEQTVEVYDQLGKRLSIEVKNGILNLSSYSNGIYLAFIQSEEKNYYFKIIKN